MSFNPNKYYFLKERERLVRNLDHGMHKLSIAGNEKKISTIGITFYLLKTNEIKSYREWYQMGSPDYEVSGTWDGVKKHLKRKIKQNEKNSNSTSDNSSIG
jgi:hypothetical protein